MMSAGNGVAEGIVSGELCGRGFVQEEVDGAEGKLMACEEKVIHRYDRVVAGARMTGAGFGGCIVAIAHRDSLPHIESALRAKYDGAGYGPCRTLLSGAGAGAAVVPF